MVPLALCLAGLVGGDMEVIRLRSGHSVRGEVLKEKTDSIVVDVGIEVLVVPRKEIVSRGKGEAPPAPVAESERRYGESGHLYATADLPRSNIKELVDRFGEAVVLVKTPGGLGSGFVIDSEGHLITNFHVIEREAHITVDIFVKSGGSFAEKSIANVEIVAINPFYDLALLKLPKREDVKLTRVYLGFSDEARQGDVVFAIGNPQGLSRSVSEGIVANKTRQVQGQLYIQTTAQINPGNSGGPLFDLRGQVIGVTNMKLVQSEGLGFAIPVDYVKDFIKNREAYAYNRDNPNTGYRYLDPPRRVRPVSKKGSGTNLETSPPAKR